MIDAANCLAWKRVQNLLSGESRSLVDIVASDAMSRITREARLAALAEQCRNWVLF